MAAIWGVNANDSAVNAAQLVSDADKALYQAKQNGRNCIVRASDLDLLNDNSKAA